MHNQCCRGAVVDPPPGGALEVQASPCCVEWTLSDGMPSMHCRRNSFACMHFIIAFGSNTTM